MREASGLGDGTDILCVVPKSLLMLKCDCLPQERLSGEEAAKRLKITPDDVYRLVAAKLLWVATTEKDGTHRFCRHAIAAIAEDPHVLESMRKALTKSGR